MRRKGLLIVIEGVDNIGKTATRDKLVSRFEVEDVPVIGLEFPYKGFHNLRSISKSSESTHYERLLAHAISHSMTYPIIDKHLDEGKVVVLDRYWYSNLAYATTFAGIPYEYIKDLEGVKLQPISPDMVVYLHSDGVYPKFHKQVQVEKEKGDAFDGAAKTERQQLLRAYEQVIRREWENNVSIMFKDHNVDEFDTLHDSVFALEEAVYNSFRGSIEKIKKDNRRAQ